MISVKTFEITVSCKTLKNNTHNQWDSCVNLIVFLLMLVRLNLQSGPVVKHESSYLFHPSQCAQWLTLFLSNIILTQKIKNNIYSTAKHRLLLNVTFTFIRYSSSSHRWAEVCIERHRHMKVTSKLKWNEMKLEREQSFSNDLICNFESISLSCHLYLCANISSTLTYWL